MNIADYFNRETGGLTELEKVVGGAKQVNDFAGFYESHVNELAAISMSAFISWSRAKEKEGGFDSKEQMAFMDGISLGLGFFNQCFMTKNTLNEVEK